METQLPPGIEAPRQKVPTYSLLGSPFLVCINYAANLMVVSYSWR